MAPLGETCEDIGCSPIEDASVCEMLPVVVKNMVAESVDLEVDSLDYAYGCNFDTYAKSLIFNSNSGGVPQGSFNQMCSCSQSSLGAPPNFLPRNIFNFV